MDELSSHVEALLGAPVGCAFLLAVQESGLTPTQAAHPATTFAVGAVAINETEIWHGDRHENEIARIMQSAQPLGGLAREILEAPGAQWWFDPPDLERQLYIWRPGDETNAVPSAVDEPDGGSFERYGQKPKTLWTSTLIDGDACVRSFIDANAGDWLDHRYPKQQWSLSAVPDARVYEITGPGAWHSLCLRYPARVGEAANNLRAKWPDPDRLTVDWRAAANDWDGVHLTFGGLLTSEQVPTSTPEGWSVMWGWASEMTVWLRYAFNGSTQLANHVADERHKNIEFPPLYR
jgi:hypothetical protein